MSAVSELTAMAPAFVDVAAKTTAVVGAAAVVVHLMRRASAASRHLVWTAALAAVVLLPLARGVVPAISLLVLPQAVPSDPTTERHMAPTPRSESISSRQPVIRDALAETAVTALRAPRSAAADRIGWTWQAVFTMVWIAGVVVLIFRAWIGTFGVWRLAKRARPADGARLLARVRHLADELRIRRPVSTLISRDDSMPITWGILSPKILLPESATEWDVDHPERLDAVLVHELAHIARLDALAQVVARAAVITQWCNPVVWFAARQARSERERACDDAVLARGTRASRYAADLLVLVQALAPPAASSSSVLSMAQGSQFEARLLAILDGGMNRRGCSNASLIVAIALVTMMAPIAAVRLAARPAVASPALGHQREIDAPVRSTVTSAVPADVAPHSSQPVHAAPPIASTPIEQTPIEQTSSASSTQHGSVNFSGTWIPRDPAAAEALFDVGLSDIPGEGLTIGQDGDTLTLTRAVSKDTLAILIKVNGSFEVTSTYHLTGGIGDRIFITTTTRSNWIVQKTLSMEGDSLRIDSTAHPNRPLLFYKQGTAKAPVNFAGTWTSDVDRNRDLIQRGLLAPADSGVVLTITQDDASISINRAGPTWNETSAYRFDGSETCNGGYYYAPVCSRVHWEGDTLVMASAGPNAKPAVTTVWSLDGSELKTAWDGPGGVPSAVYYKRATGSTGYRLSAAERWIIAPGARWAASSVTIVLDGERITGWCEIGGVHRAITGTLTGGSLTFTVTFDEPVEPVKGMQPLQSVYTGTLNGDGTLSGTLTTHAVMPAGLTAHIDSAWAAKRAK